LNDQHDRDALLERLDRLYPAVVADCLDKVGVRAKFAVGGPLDAETFCAGR